MRIGFLSLILLVAMAGGITEAQTEKSEQLAQPPAADKGERNAGQNMKSVDVTGRLVLQPGIDIDQILLYGRDAQVYIIRGEYRGLLEGILSDLGEKNLVSVTGLMEEGMHDVFVHRQQKINADEEFVSEVTCLRQYYLLVTQIKDAKISDEVMPEPKRSEEDEKVAQKSFSQQRQEDSQLISVKATITSLNFRAVVKTIGITFPDKDNKAVSKTIIINKGTRIGQKINDIPMDLTMTSLKENQKVRMQYLSYPDDINIATTINILDDK